MGRTWELPALSLAVSLRTGQAGTDTEPPQLLASWCLEAARWHIPILVVNDSSTGWNPSPFLTSLCCITHPLPPAPLSWLVSPTQEHNSQSQSPKCRVKPISHSEQSKASPVGAAASTFTGLAQGCFCFMAFTMEPVKERTCNSDF